ncbi:MAG: hypothetical protein QNJ55_04445 [Xenococcus sp. MO_188.B8]|nr:hypothetical protein [Xenococcus sp. MO_188.B8]
MDNKRLIIYHKQAASARILFFALNGSICHCDGLPPESKIVDNSIEEDRVIDYPETLIPTIKKRLELSSNILEIEKQFIAIAKSKDLTLDIYLARFTTIDPPREQLKHLGGKFIPIVEARTFPAVELELLGLVYSFLMD